MKKQFLIALTVLVGFTVQQAPAQAGEAYIGGSIIGASLDHNFGGFNDVGFFSNNDSTRETSAGIALTYGLRDQFNIGGLAITPEIELAWYKDYHTTSGSFQPPTPTFFYQSSISTGRLGLNFWAPFYDDNVWRAEAGAGFGVLYRDFKTTDTVVTGSGDDYAFYGKFGVRFLRSVGQKGNLTLGLNYIASDDTNTPLTWINNLPAGHLKVKTAGPEISIGFQIPLGS